MVWTDAQGRALTDHPRPSVAVDVAVLTVLDGGLRVLVVDGPFGRALPGTFLHPGERLADAAARALLDKAGVGDLAFHQLGLYDDPARDDRGWVLSMAHGSASPAHGLPPTADLVEVVDGRAAQPLAFDHDDMVAAAVLDLRARYAEDADPDGLLDDRFTLLELRRVHEAVAGQQLPKDTFRRRMLAHVEGTGELVTADAGRPAELFRHIGRSATP
ncbi:NUDIX hydrolase [Williamsia phyllosphaerae]|uniref:NUDIX hydrolase n=1 Tax=Williamsia phyllosphaerae TaxID=885042 RepID=A0ABQ1V4M9_9NOCA|nr:NUDIX domain-containing protein [Williamsia phyllosphaerae]GGF35062.1 NUDIX hydrolase [Williamsia phyllosphaerae]